MKSLDNLSLEGKMDLLKRIQEDAKLVFSDYSDELSVLIKDKDEKIRDKAVLCLWEYPATHFLNELIRIAKNDESNHVRCNALITLGRYIYEGSMKPYDLSLNNDINSNGEISVQNYNRTKEFLLSVHLSDKKSMDERRYALESLSFSQEKEIINLIEKAYTHKELAMKLSAINSMGRNESPKWQDILLKEIKSNNKSIQLASIQAAGQRRLIEAGEDLLKLSYSKDKEILMKTMRALGQTGWGDAFDRLYELSGSDDEEIQQTANEAMEEWHTNSSFSKEDKP
jgi:predicted transcriptional regulator with HTH domain